ncbi:MAG: hypothetical protein LBW85_07520 [Deltaproteobacteria bacterium]|jgi:F-type H+-transporting ATPase subunit epsilon|nr:hypothetical protein [Deltaproteobacteria bacterium]
MSDKNFVFTLVTPEERLVKPTQVISVNAQGKEGAFTALPGHTPFLTPILDGTVVKYVTPDNRVEEFYVDAGIIEVLPDRVSVLAEAAVRESELDPEKLAREIKEAERRREASRLLAEADMKRDPSRKKPVAETDLELQISRAVRRLKHIDKKR